MNIKLKDVILCACIVITFFGLLTFYGYARFTDAEMTEKWSNGYYIVEATLHCLLWALVITSCNPSPILKSILWLMFGTMALRLAVIVIQALTSWHTVTESNIPLILWVITFITICILLFINRKR